MIHLRVMSASTISSRERLALAVVAEVAPATVERFLSGKPIRGLCLTRIERAAKRLGISLPECEDTIALAIEAEASGEEVEQ